MPGIDFTAALNAEQLGAVTAPGGPILVLAAAGTGKTRTLVYRVAHLVEKGVPSERILLLTFTNRAAREMLERAETLIGSGVGGLWGGTFHHMANRVLRRHADAIGYAHDYTILDRDDSCALIRNCVADLKLDRKEFPKPDILLAAGSEAANTGARLGEVVERRFAKYFVDAEDIIRVLDLYEKRKRRISAMDFDDLLVNACRLFREHPAILEIYKDRFMHVLVDEYQDTNSLQATLADDAAAGHGNLFVVGDDFQCIYSWRGASFANIMTFKERYPETTVFKLETNYRSTPEILLVANACIAGNPEQYQKTLRPTRAPSQRPIVARMRDGEAQARHVMELIRQLAGEGFRMSQIAVLYRAHFHAMELQLMLAREGVQYVITSGVRFFEQAHIKDACCILRILHNPGDELSFSRLLRLLPKVGPKTAEKAWDELGGRFDAGDRDAHAKLRGLLPPPAREAWKGVEAILLEARSKDGRDETGWIVQKFVDAFYERYASGTFDDPGRRMEDIAEMMAYASKFKSIADFLGEMALFSNLDAEVADTTDLANETVRLSTVHQAKGLEWRAVIVLWVTEGMFPSARALQESQRAEAEERRLFYVAATRAKDFLCLCTPEVKRTADGGCLYSTPSRFISEIPKQLFRQAYVSR